MQTTKSRRASEPIHRISAAGNHQPRRISSYRSQKENEQHSLSRNTELEGRPSQFAHTESQLKELRVELRATKDQLASSEACRKTAEHEAEEAKMKLVMMSSNFEESQRQLIELSAAEDYRIQELRKISQERDKAWQSELAALQNQQSIEMAAWSSVTKEMQMLKSQIELLKERLVEKDSVIENLKIESELESELKEAKVEIADLKSKLIGKDAYLEGIVEKNKKSNDEIEAQVSQVEAELSSNISRSAVEISDLASELSRTESMLEFELKEAKAEIVELKANLVKNNADLRTILDINKKLDDEMREKVSQEEDEFSISEWAIGSSRKESELESELKEATAVIADLKSKLENRDADLRSILDMNKKLNSDARAQVNQIEAEFSSKIAQAAMDISELKAKLADKDAVLKPIEAELRRVQAHSNQWKKAAETAAAILMEGNSGREIERTGSVDAEHSCDGRNMKSSPNSYEMGGESPSKNHNVVRMIVGLWKKS